MGASEKHKNKQTIKKNTKPFKSVVFKHGSAYTIKDYLVSRGKWLSQLFENPLKAFLYMTRSARSSFTIMHKRRRRSSTVPSALAVVEAYALWYAAAAQRAVLQSIAAHLTTAHMTARQEDDLSSSFHADHTLWAPWSLQRAGGRWGDRGPWSEWWAGHLDDGGQLWGRRGRSSGNGFFFLVLLHGLTSSFRLVIPSPVQKSFLDAYFINAELKTEKRGITLMTVHIHR